MASTTSCARHPRTETALRCNVCDTPICPACARDAAIGMRCPSCAKPPVHGGLRRRPDQVGPAVGVAALGALVGGAVLTLVLRIGFFSLFGSYLVGRALGDRVRAAAGGNTVDVVRGVAVAGGVAAAVLAEVAFAIAFGGPIGFGGFTLLRAGLAGFAAWQASG